MTQVGQADGFGSVQQSRVDAFGRLHRRVVDTTAEIRRLFERLQDEDGPLLLNGVPGSSGLYVARIARVEADRVGIAAPGLRVEDSRPVSCQFALGPDRYLFSAALQAVAEPGVDFALPEVLYEAERRDARRLGGTTSKLGPQRIELKARAERLTAEVLDWSPHGLRISLPEAAALQLRFPTELRFLDGPRAGEVGYASLRHRTRRSDEPGQLALGLEVTSVLPGALIPIDRGVGAVGPTTEGWRRIPMASASTRRGSASDVRVEWIEYPNDRGEPIRAIVNTTGQTRGAPAVVIPPAWGGTKETLLALAATLIETFERAGEPLVVLRFDGTHRSGESYVEPCFSEPGDEYLGFTFSQAVQDIEATFAHLERSGAYDVSKIVLVTSSLGAIEGRRAVARTRSGRLRGWVSLVGMADLQAGLRTISGGIDYADGLLRGVEFGRHELAGVVADMDLTGSDAMQHRMVFLEDARRDMAQIRVPVSWIHGRDDAWMDLGRVQRLMSAGDTANRRLYEVPCGHQMRSSREAIETFQVVAREISRMVVGRELEPAPPDVRAFARRESEERGRIVARPVDLRAFWRAYLLGRDARLGIELMTATRAYSELMGRQIDLLALGPNERVVDLGAGAGDFALALAQRAGAPGGVRVTAIDHIAEALQRGRERLVVQGAPLPCASLVADLASARGGIPLGDGSVDAVLASLLLSYLDDPAAVLGEIRRVLGPGGRLVASTMRRDADISKLYVDGLAELPPDRLRERFGDMAHDEIEGLQRDFLNHASQLMRMEEQGSFRFWSAEEFETLVADAGFAQIRVEPAFGDPPQAFILRAVAD